MNNIMYLMDNYFLLILDVFIKKEISEFSPVHGHPKQSNQFFLDLSNACIEIKSMLPDGTKMRKMSLYDVVKGVLIFQDCML